SVGGSSFRHGNISRIGTALEGAAGSARQFGGALRSAMLVASTVTSALASNVIIRYADTYNRLYNQIRAVSDSSADAAIRFNALSEVAARSRSSLEATTILYSRLQKA